MCGIAGKVTTGEPVDRALHEAQLDLIAHRGPDGAGMHVDGHVAIGMRRLAIIDLEHGQQPLYSEDGTIALVLNGELYTYREQRAALQARGHVFATGSDAEVAVHLYEEHGSDFVRHLHGMFALALWDARAGRLILARDRIGKKPLVWSQTADGAVVFASEPRAVLVDPAVDRELDLGVLDATLATQYVPPLRTPWRSVHQLPPGGRMMWEPRRGAPAIDRYWTPEFTPKQQIGLDDAAAELRERLRVAVNLRLRSDVPVGAFLSGGLDSSIVVAAMAQEAELPVRTFSARFADAAFDEGPWAREVADRWGTQHTELDIAPVDEGTLRRLIWHLGVPLADPACVPAFQLAELAAQHVTVVLTGDGGDETFAGYRRYHHLAWTRAAQILPAGAWRALAGAPGLPPRAARLAGRLALSPVDRYADLFRHLRDPDRDAVYGPLLRPLLATADPLAALRPSWDRTAGLSWTDRLLACDQDGYLPGALLPKADLTSMAHGLELRSPLLDQDLVAWAATLPPRLKRRGATGKRVLRAAADPWLSHELITRRKQGFAVPVADWLRGPLAGLADDVLLGQRTRERGLLDPAGVARVMRAHRAGEDHAGVLWSMLVLELWCRTCHDLAPVVRPRPLVV